MNQKVLIKVSLNLCALTIVLCKVSNETNSIDKSTKNSHSKIDLNSAPDEPSVSKDYSK